MELSGNRILQLWLLGVGERRISICVSGLVSRNSVGVSSGIAWTAPYWSGNVSLCRLVTRRHYAVAGHGCMRLMEGWKPVVSNLFRPLTRSACPTTTVICAQYHDEIRSLATLLRFRSLVTPLNWDSCRSGISAVLWDSNDSASVLSAETTAVQSIVLFRFADFVRCLDDGGRWKTLQWTENVVCGGESVARRNKLKQRMRRGDDNMHVVMWPWKVRLGMENNRDMMLCRLDNIWYSQTLESTPMYRCIRTFNFRPTGIMKQL